MVPAIGAENVAVERATVVEPVWLAQRVEDGEDSSESGDRAHRGAAADELAQEVRSAWMP